MIKAHTTPIGATALEGDVVISGEGCGPYAPEAVLESLDGLEMAAFEAILQRERSKDSAVPV